MISASYNEFVLTHVFKNVSSLKDGEDYFGDVEEHFNVPWKLSVTRESSGLGLYIHCDKLCKDGNWSVDTNFEIKIMSVNGKINSETSQTCFQSSEDKQKADGVGFNFLDWDQMKKDYAVDDKLFVEARVKIKKITGLNKRKRKLFDETTSDVSDIVLIVEDEKFHVSKLFLARQSSYFKSLFLGNFKEAKKSGISLTGIESEKFQNFLEVLHGEDVNDDTVEGVLNLADMYDTPSVYKKCEEFLIEKSEKSLKVKLQTASRYKMKKLQNFCFVKIKTKEDVRSVLPGDLSELDPSVSSHLMRMLASID